MTDPTHPQAAPRREVTSFVRRGGRMTQGQLRAWHMYAPHFVVPLPGLPHSGIVEPREPLDLESLFGRRAPIVVEIGPGMGESLAAMAARHPDRDFIAFEVYEAGAAGLILKLARAEVDNVRVIVADAVSGLRHLLAPGSLTEVLTFFPDPWPKARHHKRRLVDTAFADLVADRLTSDGLWRLATDWQEYADQMREVLDPHPQFTNLHDGWAPRFDERILTRFENRGIREGRTIRDLTYRRS
ncbi:tRNA (guanosine(46)-N7)-methyltransferase TrmB [Microlunatus sp. Y2014]|uniref:tRNA (guanosine(46)-N7)-methyltransferase TrmB n=1 Tax=Microlunatus sp. Y2014 TaxID=3418488 RepID=UPI003DA738F9